MSLKDKMQEFRSPDIREYPELEGYTGHQIYDGFIGCGGLYLATKMIRQMNLEKGDRVLDLGCGMGSSSIWLAKNFDIIVIAVDLWNSPDRLAERANMEGLSDRIIPLQIDITQSIPFAHNYFDAIFCMNSLFMFGENPEFLQCLLHTLKPGGTLCVGSECFNKEPDFLGSPNIPDVYDFNWNWSVWESCYSKYYSPRWWRALLNSTGLLDIQYCDELDDGRVMFEDFALNYDSYLNQDLRAVGAVIPQEKIVDQVLYGLESGLYPTLYVLRGVRK